MVKTSTSKASSCVRFQKHIPEMNCFARIRGGIPGVVPLRLALAEKSQRCRVGGRIAPAPVLEPRSRAGVLDEKIDIAPAFEVDRPVAVLRAA